MSGGSWYEQIVTKQNHENKFKIFENHQSSVRKTDVSGGRLLVQLAMDYLIIWSCHGHQVKTYTPKMYPDGLSNPSCVCHTSTWAFCFSGGRWKARSSSMAWEVSLQLKLAPHFSWDLPHSSKTWPSLLTLQQQRHFSYAGQDFVLTWTVPGTIPTSICWGPCCQVVWLRFLENCPGQGPSLCAWGPRPGSTMLVWATRVAHDQQGGKDSGSLGCSWTGRCLWQWSGGTALRCPHWGEAPVIGAVLLAQSRLQSHPCHSPGDRCCRTSPGAPPLSSEGLLERGLGPWSAAMPWRQAWARL